MKSLQRSKLSERKAAEGRGAASWLRDLMVALRAVRNHCGTIGEWSLQPQPRVNERVVACVLSESIRGEAISRGRDYDFDRPWLRSPGVGVRPLPRPQQLQLTYLRTILVNATHHSLHSYPCPTSGRNS